MNEFEKSMQIVKKVLRAQFISGAALVAGFASYQGVVTGAWAGTAMFAGGGMVVLSVIIWLMRLRTESLLRKVTTD